MLNARGMFEKLGFKKIYSILDDACYFNKKDNVRIRFHQTEYGNCVLIEDDCHMATFITINEIQAINKQIEELGWK